MLKENFKGSNQDISCKMCTMHPDTQEMSVNCPQVINEDKNEEEILNKYFKLFNYDVPEVTVN